MIQEFIKKVGDFHDAFGVKRGNVDVELRYKLFLEEFNEYKEAKDLVEKTDAIVDMLYIACGTIDLHEWKGLPELEFDLYENENYCLNYIKTYLDGYLIHGKEGWVFDIISILLDLSKHNNIYEILPQLFQEVHDSNFSKLDDNGKPIINDGILDPNKPIGKILKGKNYFEPRLKEILENGN